MVPIDKRSSSSAYFSGLGLQTSECALWAHGHILWVFCSVSSKIKRGNKKCDAAAASPGRQRRPWARRSPPPAPACRRRRRRSPRSWGCRSLLLGMCVLVEVRGGVCANGASRRPRSVVAQRPRGAWRAAACAGLLISSGASVHTHSFGGAILTLPNCPFS